MKFRTQLDIRRSAIPVRHSDRIVTLGSCFSDEIGGRLADAGFDVAVNPMGVLFNPISIASMVHRAIDRRTYSATDLYTDNLGIHHILDFESRRRDTVAGRLLDTVNADFAVAAEKILDADVLIVTFGTAWCFTHLPSARIVGNCHKLPDTEFERSMVSVDRIVDTWRDIAAGRRVIFTVSPVRHLNDGLHGNSLSKARLLLAVDKLCNEFDAVEYFPAYEALVDDLRDYRFYADDLKHPSKMGADYVYELFGRMFFDRETALRAEQATRDTLHSRHRPILDL